MDKIPIRIIRKKSFKNRVLSFVNFSLFKNVFSGILVGLVFAGLFSAGFFVLATANYYPGQTTTPTCSPTDPDCTVTPSAVYSFTSNNFSGTGDFTTTGTVKAGTLGVGTNYTFPTSAGSANKFLGYDGAGTFGWQTVTSTDISGLVPYTGANATVNLGSQALTTSGSGTFSGASGIILGTQTTTNIPGTAKFLAAGSNSAFYTTITAGTNTGNTTITLPTANPAGTYLLNMTSGGVMGYDSTAYLTSSTGLLATGATTGATSQAQVFTNGVTLSNITSGSMLFAGTAGVVSQNNNSFSWDNGTQQLAIGYNPSGVNYPDQNMTANNAPSPYVASASSEWNSSYAAWKAFDNNSATGWLTTTTGWLKIDLGTNRTIQVYKLQEVEDVTRMAKDWTLDGSTNNIDWTTGLDTQTNAPAWGVNEIRTYNIDPSKVGSYRYYRINVTANKGNDTYLEIGGFTLLNVSATHPTVTSKLYLYTASASNKGLIVQGASGQTANLAEFQNSAGTVLSSINANGSLTLPAGTATAGTAPLYFTSGTSLTSAVAGAMEYDGTNFYFSPSTTRYMIPLSTGTAANTLLFTTTGSTTLTLPTSGTLVNSAVATLSSLTSTGTITTGGLGTGATLGAVTMNIASSAVGDIYYAGASNVLTRLADVAVGSYLRSGGTTTAPLWSTLILPNAGTAYKLAAYTATNTLGELSAVGATGEYLAGATGAIPAWATLNQAAVAGLTTSDTPSFAALTATGATGLTLGTQTTTNIPGTAKFLAAGSNSAYYTTLTAGTNTGNTTITLPTANPAGTYLLNMTSSGVLGYDSTTYLTSSTGLLATGSTTGATAISQTFTNGVTLSNISAGSMLFAGTAGLVSQNYYNLFWDDTNKRIALGYVVPTSFTYTKISPTMTANDAPSPYVVSASSELSSSYAAWKAFDNDAATFWKGANALDWLKIDFGTATTTNSYRITDRTASGGGRPKSWTFEGSATGAFAGEQTALDIQTSVPDWSDGEVRTYSYNQVTSGTFRYYRFNITANWSAAQMAIFEFSVGNSTIVYPAPAPLAKLQINTVLTTEKGLIIQGASGQTANLAEFQNSAGTVLSSINANGSLTLPAGTATAGTAPLYFTSGTSLTSAVAGAMEFTTDDLFFTITTGTARKRL
ncbi:MAG: discoidin domain-containing protein, partial [Candidatus Staskawiczbacteria bacterium]|nr:discoidin domain-containing protein [Candidatus Staskawiczbacteria bacterium]